MWKWILVFTLGVMALSGATIYLIDYQEKRVLEDMKKQPIPDVPNHPVSLSIKTPKGEIVIEIRPDLLPRTCGNFLKLVDSKFYNGLTFHRVEDWVVQGGDPKGDGSGGPGWTILFESHTDLKNVRGAVAMARGMDINSAGSQFYILTKDAAWLDGKYAVFGKVIKGMDIVDQIRIGDTMEIIRQ